MYIHVHTCTYMSVTFFLFTYMHVNLKVCTAADSDVQSTSVYRWLHTVY